MVVDPAIRAFPVDGAAEMLIRALEGSVAGGDSTTGARGLEIWRLVDGRDILVLRTNGL